MLLLYFLGWVFIIVCVDEVFWRCGGFRRNKLLIVGGFCLMIINLFVVFGVY